MYMRQNYRISKKMYWVIHSFIQHKDDLPAKKFSTFRVSSPIWCEHKYWDSCLTGLSKWSAVSCCINSSGIKSRECVVSVISITSVFCIFLHSMMTHKPGWRRGCWLWEKSKQFGLVKNLPCVQLSQYICSHQWVGWTLKVLFFLFVKTCVETANNKVWHSVVLSHIYLLIIFSNVLTPQPTGQFCLYSYLYIYIYIYIYIHWPKL